MLDEALNYSTLFANLFTIAASGIALYLYLFKRKRIASAISVLLNYSYQLTLSELKEKIERLNDLTTNDPEQLEKILNIFHEIIGQIRGNKKLKKPLFEILARIEKLVDKPDRVNDQVRRSLTAELREQLRQLNIENIDGMAGEEK